MALVNTCRDCDTPIPSRRQLCSLCRLPALICDACGTLFRRPRALLRHNRNDPRYAGRVFCSRACFHASREPAGHDAA
jgi:hypothetical protein